MTDISDTPDSVSFLVDYDEGLLDTSPFVSTTIMGDGDIHSYWVSTSVLPPHAGLRVGAGFCEKHQVIETTAVLIVLLDEPEGGGCGFFF
jgi:hypothetical protein